MQRSAVIYLFLVVILTTSLQKELKKDIDSRIVNGERAQIGQFPWQVALQVENENMQWFCGGSIISKEWILTAGHCVYKAINATIKAGIVELNDSTAIQSYADTFILHEEYDPDSLENDIGLIKLGDPLQLPIDDRVAAIPIAEEELSDGVEITISGWGITSDNNISVNPVLNFIQLRTITNEQCSEEYKEDPIFKGTVCANSAADQPKSPCSGDSGGPVVMDADKDPIQVAIASFVSDDGCEAGRASGYVRTAFYREWIRNNGNI